MRLHIPSVLLISILAIQISYVYSDLQPPPDIDKADLKGYWLRYDRVNDESGNGETLTAIGNPTVRDGRFFRTFNFDGIDDYLHRNAGTPANIQTFTISAWIKRGVIGNYHTIASTGIPTYSSILRPDADGGAQSWTPIPAGTHYTTVDEVVYDPNPPDTSDRIETTTSGAEILRLSTVAIPANVTTVKVKLYAMADVNKNVDVYLRWSDVDQSSVRVTFTPTYTWFTVTFSVNLNQAQVDSLDVKFVRPGPPVSDVVRVAALYTEIYFDAAVCNWSLYIDTANTLKFDFGDGNITPVSLTSNSQISDTNWHHVAFSRDQNSGVHKFYIDGVMIRSVTNSQTISYCDADFAIGDDLHATLVHNFQGAISEVRFWNSVLSDDKIKAVSAIRVY